MFRNTYQKGFLSVFFSIGSNPLAIWKNTVRNFGFNLTLHCASIYLLHLYFTLKVSNGHIKRLTDNDLKSVALEIMGVNVATTYISTPIEPRASLAIKLPFLVLIVKNMKKFFSFEVQVKGVTRRRVRI